MANEGKRTVNAARIGKDCLSPKFNRREVCFIQKWDNILEVVFIPYNVKVFLRPFKLIAAFWETVVREDKQKLTIIR